MKRILVTGNAGSGKSTLARRISLLLGMPCHGLDRIVWQPGWQKTPQHEKVRKIQDLVEKDSWVIDGVSTAAQAQADVVVFIDVPRKVSFWRVIKRNWRYLFRSRPDLPERCPEVLIIPTLCKIIWDFPSKVRPAILDLVEQDGSGKAFFQVKTSSEIEDLLSVMESWNAQPGAALNSRRPAIVLPSGV